ncbi:FAD-dependent monooxygenase [Streptomyces sp. CAU 1734]|uniref:FAD-dependent monooxygenase n=1 Tax=Streptomyces sp. CAU 1734 TaxID=3140360 RepID=UPI0032611A31
MSRVRVGIVGGSIGGCAAALAAHRAGLTDITVYERTSGDLADRGVGIAVHEGRYAELEAAGYLDSAMEWSRLAERCWYTRAPGGGGDPLGRLIGSDAFPFRSYNWGPLWRELRSRLPAEVAFRTSSEVTGVVGTRTGAELRTAAGADHYGLVIGADGYRSAVRAAVCPAVRPEYAGYLAWRGAYPERRLPDPGLWEKTTVAYVVFRGGHVVIYRIPDGSGGHRVNWVLYSAPPPGLGIPLATPTSLPPGTLGEALHSHLARLTEEHLPPFWAELTGLTAPGELLVQPMYDFAASPGVTARLALVGDAAAVARPHTGAGAVKALQDAALLESALRTASDTGIPEALAGYGAARETAGRAMVELGRRLGSGLVEHTPRWSALDRGGLDAWWKRADAAGTFGGKRLGRE